MSVSIKYKGEEIAQTSVRDTLSLKTRGKYCEDNIIIDNTPDGGGGYTDNEIEFTLVSATQWARILSTYIQECLEFVMYATDADDRQLNTFLQGTGFWGEKSPTLPADSRYYGETTPTGITVGNTSYSYMTNDQTYNAVRTRASITNRPAGNYTLKFYGVAK